MAETRRLDAQAGARTGEQADAQHGGQTGAQTGTQHGEQPGAQAGMKRDVRPSEQTGVHAGAAYGSPTEEGRAKGAPAPCIDEPIDIRAEDVEAVLGGTKILDGVSLGASAHELVGLIGPNGSGKSTLLKCLYRVLAPTGGAVYLGGRELRDYSVRESARRVAVLAQHNYYNFEFSVRDVVLMGRSPHKGNMERDNAHDFEVVADALKTVGMEDFATRSFSTLSGGEQQRVILARALAQQTPCLILDEPTNHLDIKYQLELMDIVKGLRRTVICAVHDLNIGAMYCDRLYAIKGGHVVTSGTPEEVITPAFIRELYDVDAKVIVDDDGVRHVLYHPGSVMG